jgi:hypothetical protein
VVRIQALTVLQASLAEFEMELTLRKIPLGAAAAPLFSSADQVALISPVAASLLILTP